MKAFIAIILSSIVSVNCVWELEEISHVAFDILLPEYDTLNVAQNLQTSKHDMDSIIAIFRAWQYGLTKQGLGAAAAINEVMVQMMLKTWPYAEPRFNAAVNEVGDRHEDAMNFHLAVGMPLLGYEQFINSWHNEPVQLKTWDCSVLQKNYTHERDGIRDLIVTAVKKFKPMPNKQIFYELHNNLLPYWDELFVFVDKQIKNPLNLAVKPYLYQHMLDHFDIHERISQVLRGFIRTK